MTDLPPPPMADPFGDQATKPAWWKRRWVHITAGVVVALLVLGAIVGEDEDAEDAGVSVVEQTTTEPASEPEPEPTTTEAPTTTAAPTTTTTEAPPDPETLRQESIEIFAAVIEANRIELAEALESDTFIESVDALTFDPETGVLSISATSGYATDEYRANEMWEVVRTLAHAWAEDGAFVDAHFSPGLAFSNGRESFACAPEFMERLARRVADRDAWEAEC